MTKYCQHMMCQGEIQYEHEKKKFYYFKCYASLFESDLVKGYKLIVGLWPISLDRSGGQGAFNTCYYIIFFFFEYEWMTQYFTWWNDVINPDSLLGWHGVRKKKKHSKAFTVVCGAVRVCCEKVLLLNKYLKNCGFLRFFFLTLSHIHAAYRLYSFIKLVLQYRIAVVTWKTSSCEYFKLKRA